MTAPTDDAPIGYPEASEKGLKGGALGLLSSVVVGMASTAPAYSLAASLGLVVASGGALLAGVKAPAILVLAFVPMYFIAVSYQELNKAEPDCGTTFTWASRAFGPMVGWLGGWGIIAADVIVMANLAQVAGSYSYTLVGLTDLADSTLWSTVAGLVWIAVMTWICYKGIEVSARLQYALLGIEVVILVAFAVVALAKVWTGNAESYSLTPSLSWLWPGGLSFGDVVAPALLTAFFIYWGWDTAVACNEETDDPGRTPGRAAVISTVLLLLTYAVVAVATVAFAGTGTEGVGLGNPENAADVFHAIGPELFGDSAIGKVFMALLAASILTSASASTQTTILPTARTALSMGVFRALPRSFARVHPTNLTPTVATIGMGVVSAVFYLAFTWLGSNMLSALIGSIGLMIAFYYGLTGFVCVWYYRKTLWHNPRDLFMQGVIPLLGGVIMLATFVYGLKQFLDPEWLTDDAGDPITIFGYGAVGVTGVLALGLGVVLMFIWWGVDEDFFMGRTLSMRTSRDLVLAGPHVDATGARMPGSGLPEIVIAEDLSNLPEGVEALDPVTRERYTREPGEG
ncbi:APC family permease [Phycicoccus sonneratiae]|uniref:APC family permease n=1 Tax=Phycicoccus sonneratiae TaxID=2807628 RepID=A0ABS2CJJ4_9MICO|nr:APC family permease [Phycicoccus sonneraticus]MBM6400056.1 APC family permease [Phycicoccus sonneraticus]